VTALADVVFGFFEADGWSLVDAGDGHTHGASVEGDNGRWTTVVQVFDDRGVFAFYSVAPLTASVERAEAVVEFVTRANAGMVTGNFEFEYRSGQVRYKTALDLGGLGDDRLGALAAGGALGELVRDLVYSNVGTLDRYLPGLVKVIAAAAEPAAAIAEIEG
jgi:hypothetical protein